MNSTTNRFSLITDTWYSCEFIGEEFVGFEGSLSRIKVYSIEPAGSGRREFTLRFYHKNYPEGVRDKEYRMRTLERGRNFLLAESLEHIPKRILYITGKAVR